MIKKTEIIQYFTRNVLRAKSEKHWLNKMVISNAALNDLFTMRSYGGYKFGFKFGQSITSTQITWWKY